MSKRHHVQPSQDLRAPPARGARAAGRGQHSGGLRVRARRLGPGRPGRPARLPRPAQPAHPLRARRLSDGRLRGRSPAHVARGLGCRGRSGCPRPTHRRRPDARPPARPGAVRAGRRTNRLGLVLGAIVVAFMLAFFSLAQQVRVSATGYDIGRLELERQRPRRPGVRHPLRPEPPRARAGHPQAGHRRRTRTAGRAARPRRRASDRSDRCWAAPIRAAGSCSCCPSSSSDRAPLAARLAYWQVSTASGWLAEAVAQTTVTLDTPSKRGEIYDRTGTVVLATTVQRDRLVAAPDS